MEKNQMITCVCESPLLSDDKKTFLIDSILNGKFYIAEKFTINSCFIYCDNVNRGYINFDTKEIVIFTEKFLALCELSGYDFAFTTINILNEVKYPITTTTKYEQIKNNSYLYDSVNILPYMKFVFNSESVLQYYSFVGSVNEETQHLLQLTNQKHNKHTVPFIDYVLSKRNIVTSEPIMTIKNIFIYKGNIIFEYNSNYRDEYTLTEDSLIHTDYNSPTQKKTKKQIKTEHKIKQIKQKQNKKQKQFKQFTKYVNNTIQNSDRRKVTFHISNGEKQYSDWLQDLCVKKGYKLKIKKHTFDSTFKIKTI
jgi:hypothetical protein